MFFIVVSVIIELIAISYCGAKLGSDYPKQYIKSVKTSLSGVIISSIIQILGATGIFLAFENPLNFPKELSAICLIMGIGGWFPLLFFWVNCPNDKKVKMLESISNIDSNLSKKGFKISKKISFTGGEFFIDTINKKIAVVNHIYACHYIISTEDIIECEILEDNDVIMKGGIGRAVVGGMIAGGVGAIVGANTHKSSNVCNSLKIRIITTNPINAMYTIDFIKTQSPKNELYYTIAFRIANEVYSCIISMISQKGNSSVPNVAKLETDFTVSNSDDLYASIEKLATLRDKGIITEEEFITKKKEMLNKI